MSGPGRPKKSLEDRRSEAIQARVRPQIKINYNTYPKGHLSDLIEKTYIKPYTDNIIK